MSRNILIVTDNWHPEVNGVVTTLVELTKQLGARGHEVHVISPQDYPTLRMPFFNEVRLSLANPVSFDETIDRLAPDGVHITTEGPLGMLARRYCQNERIPFSTAMHTCFPDYMKLRFGFPASSGYAYLKWFHGAAEHCLVPTPTVARSLERRGFRHIRIWPRGVDTSLFHPSRRQANALSVFPRPVFLYVGRVAPEKSVEQFLSLDLPGSKVVVGDGPSLQSLRASYPGVHFLGEQKGTNLANIYASADCLVFPSRTDTFGIVMLEALASGTPVAAYPVSGPLDVIGDSGAGALDEDLGKACRTALGISREKCREYAAGFSWSQVADDFLTYLPDIGRRPVSPLATRSGSERRASQ